MNLRHRVLTSLLLVAAASPAALAADAAPVDWPSMSTAKVATPLPATGPTATELITREATKAAGIPLPPPPAGTKLTSASGTGDAKAPAVAPAKGAAATGAGLAAIAGADTSPEKATEGAKPGEPKVRMAADQTGAMVSMTQDLESDKLRQDWAASGGTLPGFEVNAGMTLMYKDLSALAGAGAYMNGVGFNVGGRVVLYTLEPPKYETRDRNWIAWKIGGGMDLGALTTTTYIPATYTTVLGRTYQNGPFVMTGSMSSFTLVGTAGFMYAIGSFDSPESWTGFAIGADWAPSYQSTSITDSESNTTTTSSSFNATGFAINFESGSMKSIAAKMGKKARLKVSVFFLPPTGDLPLLVTGSLGAVWY